MKKNIHVLFGITGYFALVYSAFSVLPICASCLNRPIKHRLTKMRPSVPMELQEIDYYGIIHNFLNALIRHNSYLCKKYMALCMKQKKNPEADYACKIKQLEQKYVSTRRTSVYNKVKNKEPILQKIIQSMRSGYEIRSCDGNKMILFDMFENSLKNERPSGSLRKAVLSYVYDIFEVDTLSIALYKSIFVFDQFPKIRDAIFRKRLDIFKHKTGFYDFMVHLKKQTYFCAD